MSAAEIYVHGVNRVAAVRKESNGSVWVDLTIFGHTDDEIILTLFPENGPDPRFAALAEFIAATWPTEGAKAVETPDQYTNYLDRVAAEAPTEDLPF